MPARSHKNRQQKPGQTPSGSTVSISISRRTTLRGLGAFRSSLEVYLEPAYTCIFTGVLCVWVCDVDWVYTLHNLLSAYDFA